MKTLIYLSFIFVFLNAVTSSAAQPPETPLVQRPPQYVLLAFDNCDSPEFWKETIDYSKDLSATQGKNVHFTYFMSGVYFLTQKNKDLYTGPHHGAGASDIGFAPDNKYISDRIKQINSSIRNGHEIGSHAVGHFDASHWDELDWINEFNYFFNLISGVFVNNKMPTEEFILDPTRIVGFRTPYLSYSAGLWPALSKFHFRYDTSRTAPPHYWPQKLNGIWNFPLAEVMIAGTNRKTLSMDYNFYVAQSHARDDLAHADYYSKQMVATYLNYFADNYNGNRAPVNIGHHFRQMNGGAYWQAMKTFADTVCGLPEVKCVTYTEFSDFMDAQSAETIRAYTKGNFEKLTPLNLNIHLSAQNFSPPPASDDRLMKDLEARMLLGDMPEAHLAN